MIQSHFREAFSLNYLIPFALIYLVYFRKATKDMSLRKVMQKQSKKTIVESEFTEMAPIFVDIVCDVARGAVAWEVI